MRSITNLSLEHKTVLAAVIVALICILLPSFQITLSGSAMIGMPMPNVRMNLSILDIGKGSISIPVLGDMSINDIRSLGGEIPPALHAAQASSIILMLGIIASAILAFLHVFRYGDARIQRNQMLGALAISAILSLSYVIVMCIAAQWLINDLGASQELRFGIQIGAVLLPVSLAASTYFMYQRTGAIARPVTEDFVAGPLCPDCGRPLFEGRPCVCQKPAPIAACPDCGRPLRKGQLCECRRSAAASRRCANCGEPLKPGEACNCMWSKIEL